MFSPKKTPPGKRDRKTHVLNKGGFGQVKNGGPRIFLDPKNSTSRMSCLDICPQKNFETNDLET